MSRTSRRPARRSRDEQGAVAILTAALMALLLTFAAFAVDLGTQRVAVRDVQALADVAALDAARLLDGRTAAQIKLGDATRASLDRTVLASQQRNDDQVVGRGLRVKGYLVTLDAAGRWARGTDGLPVEVAAGAVPRAVVVVASSTVDFGFARVVGISSGNATRAAAATASVPSVCFSIGTKVLTLNTSQSALSPILDTILRVNLSAVGYGGLVDTRNTSIPIAGLLAELNVGSVDQLATTNVRLGQFLLAAATVAERNGSLATATALRAVRLGSDSATLNLASILSLQSGTDVAGLTSTINVLDVVGAAVVAANGQNAVVGAVPGLAELRVTEPPKIACGARGATASTAQISLRVKPTLLANAGLGLVSGTTDLTIQVGRGTATIAQDLSCAPESVTLTVVTAGASVAPPVDGAFGQVGLVVTLAKFLSVIPAVGAVTSLALSLLGIDRVGLDVLVVGSAASTTQTSTITYPAAPALPGVLTVPASGAGSVLSLNATGVRLTPGQNSGLLGILAPLLNASLALVLNGLVSPIVNTVVSPTLSAVLNPVLSALGIKLGVADVTMLGRPVCNGSKLVG